MSWTGLFVAGNHKHWLINYSRESWLLLNIGSVHAQWTHGSKFRAKGIKIILTGSRLRWYCRFRYYRLFRHFLPTPTWLGLWKLLCKNWCELYEMCICSKLTDDEAVWGISVSVFIHIPKKNKRVSKSFFFNLTLGCPVEICRNFKGSYCLHVEGRRVSRFSCLKVAWITLWRWW